MREYPDYGFKIEDSVLEDIKEYHELREFLDSHGTTLKQISDWKNGGLDANEVFDEDVDKAAAEYTELEKRLKEAFEKKYPGFSVSLRDVDSQAEGDISEPFWELKNVVKPEAFSLAHSVSWTVYG